MSERTSGPATGLLESLTTLAATLVAIAHTRLDLLAVDLEEEREWQLSQLILVLVILFFLGVGAVLVTIFLVVTVWETQGINAVGGIAAGYLAVGALAWFIVLRRARQKPRMFSASLAELLKDRQHLLSRHE